MGNALNQTNKPKLKSLRLLKLIGVLELCNGERFNAGGEILFNHPLLHPGSI